MMNSTNEEQKPKFGCKRGLWRIPFVIAAIVLIKSAAVLLLWNALIPDLFHGPILGYWQAVGLVVLAKLLFGTGRAPGKFGPPWARWKELSHEDRLKLREALRNRCGS